MENRCELCRAQLETVELRIRIAAHVAAENAALAVAEARLDEEILGIGLGIIIRLETIQILVIELLDAADESGNAGRLVEGFAPAHIEVAHLGLEHDPAEILFQRLQDFALPESELRLDRNAVFICLFFFKNSMRHFFPEHTGKNIRENILEIDQKTNKDSVLFALLLSQELIDRRLASRVPFLLFRSDDELEPHMLAGTRFAHSLYETG